MRLGKLRLGHPLGSGYQGPSGWGGDGELSAPGLEMPQLSPSSAPRAGVPSRGWHSGQLWCECDTAQGRGGGHQDGCCTLRVPSLSSRGATECQSRELWGETSLPGCAEPVVWQGTSVSPVCHQCVSRPDHCQMLGCTWDLTQPWSPRALGGLRVLRAALGLRVALAGGPSPAEMSSQSHSGTALLWKQEQGLCPRGLCPTPLVQGHAVPRAAGLCLRGASAEVGAMPPPVSATCPRRCLAGQRGCHCRAVGKPRVIPV